VRADPAGQHLLTGALGEGDRAARDTGVLVENHATHALQWKHEAERKRIEDEQQACCSDPRARADLEASALPLTLRPRSA
jgi:hypothetical protein